jgi:peptide/nickel transport system substrate-binding protein
VKFNYDRFTDPQSPQYSKTAAGDFDFIHYSSEISKVEVIDPLDVRITLKVPDYEWLRSGIEDCPQAYIISPAAITKYGDAGLPLHPIGTGPFRFVSRTIGTSIVLERNPDYWGTPAKLDKIIFREIEDPATRMNALRAGEAQIIQEPVWNQIESLKKEGFTITENQNAPTLWYITFNTRNKVTKDPKVRKALLMAIDREAIAKQILKGYGGPGYGMLNPGTYAFDPHYKSYPYDPKEAKALLAGAGYGSGLKIKYILPKYGYGELVEKAVQRDLAKVGVDVELVPMEWLDYLNTWNAGMADDVAMQDMIWGEQTPVWTAFSYRCADMPPNGWNNGWYCNKKVDDLLNQAQATRDRPQAAKLYQQADAMAMDSDAPYGPLYYYYNPIAVAPSVKGFVNAPANWWDLSGVSLSQ